MAEDEEDIFTTISFALRAKGYDVCGASDGEEALKKVEEENPDVIILDVKMPKKDGYEVCKILKSDERFKKIPVLMFTALKEDKKGYDSGADAFMIKSFATYEDIIFKITELLLAKGHL